MNIEMEQEIAVALGPEMTPSITVREVSPASLASWFAVSDLAVASMRAAACEMADFIGATHVEIDRRLALMWFGMTLRPEGWTIPGTWEAIAGDYEARDGWIKLHTNVPRHRIAALEALGCEATRDAVAEAVAGWRKTELEDAVIAAGGAGGGHAQPLGLVPPSARHGCGPRAPDCLAAGRERSGPPPGYAVCASSTLTRVLAGPVATRFLAGFGADVLRIDPPGWNEANVEPEVTLGKRLAGLDLRRTEDRSTFERQFEGRGCARAWIPSRGAWPAWVTTSSD